jgi:hypothetical protein
MNSRFPNALIVLVLGTHCFTTTNLASAGGKFGAARELIETVCEKFGKKLTQESTESLVRRADDAIVRYGDDAAEAIRKVGPRSLDLIEQAGDHAPDAVRLMARRGDEAVWVISQPKRLAIFVKHGDDAAEAMIRHREIVEPILQSLGKPGAKALANVNSQNARRIAMMVEDGDLTKIGRTPEVLGVVERFGDRAMQFIWRHKFVLAGGTALAAFLQNPEPFLDGTQKVAVAGVNSIGAPIATQAANQIHWPAVTYALVAAILIVTWRILPRRPAVASIDHRAIDTEAINR